MHPRAFRWLHRDGFAPGALLPSRARVPKPLATQPLEGARLAWVPLAEPRAAGLLPGLAGEGLLLFPPAREHVPRVVDAWLRLYEEAPEGIGEAVLQVVDDAAHLRSYLAAEEALWERIYAWHPHKLSKGILPRALDEARWLEQAVLGHPQHDARAEFLTLEAFEAIARALLVTVRRAEMLHLRDHLRGVDGFNDW